MAGGSLSFEVPSTSGRERLRFEVAGAPGALRLLGVYESAIWDGDGLDPSAWTTRLPPVRVARHELESLHRLFREYADRMTSREAQGAGVELVVSGGVTLALRLEPGPPGVCAPWQAKLSFRVLAGVSLCVAGGFILDATCLDLCGDDLAACLDGLPES